MIAYDDFQGSGPPLHFLHANGYPPAAYRSLLERLSSQFHVTAMHMRPLWTGTIPEDLHDWQPLVNDLEAFLMQQDYSRDSDIPTRVVGVGHSMGATITLRLALRNPGIFSKLVLIDPVLFPPQMIFIWEIISRFGLVNQLHPMVKNTLRRRNRFENRQEMFEHYRKKTIFNGIPSDCLWDYVNSQACDLPEGGIRLCYSPQWEAHLYATGIKGDMALWHALPTLRTPVLLLRGSHSNTFWYSAARLFKRKLPDSSVVTIPETSHLLPLERSAEVAELMLSCLS